MFNKLEYVKETIELRREDIENNEFETNNLLLDDILIALGYNKRREPGVKALYSSNADWEIIYNGETRFIVAVYGYNSDKPTIKQLEPSFEFADINGFRFVLLTDGERLAIYGDREELADIQNIFDESSDEILSALSKQGWNPEYIKSLSINNILTDDNILNTIKNNIDTISFKVLELLDVKNTELALDKTREVILSLGGKTENIETNAELNNAKATIEKLNLDLNSAKESISKLTQELQDKDSNTENEESIQKIAELNSRLNELELTLKSKDAKINEIQAIIDEYKQNELKLNQENELLKQKNSEIQESLNSTNNENTDNYDEGAYREKIATLTEDKQKLTMELAEYKDKLEEMERKQAGDEDKQVVMARQLLEAVEDNEELNRTYVGVVNSKLFQISELTKFVGTCLQELYLAVSFELMHLLFDGDIFKIIQPAVRTDLLINTKAYDIDISELSEEEVLSRLKTLFSKFDNVVFMCKAIGTYKEPAIIENEYVEDYTELDEIGIEELDDIPLEDNLDSDSFSNEIAFEDSELDIGGYNKILGLALVDVGSVIWSQGNPIKTLYALNDGVNTFKISNDTYENIVNSTITSMLTICNSSLESLNLLRNTDLTTLSASIHRDKLSDTDIQILDTCYYTDVDNMRKCVSMLLAVADILNIDTTRVYMYFEADYIDGNGLEENYIDREMLVIPQELDIDSLEKCNDTIHCIISGTSILNIQEIESVLNVERLVIDKAIAARTAYMTNALRSNTDIAKAVATCLAQADMENIPDIISRINKIVNYETNVILGEDEEHSDEAIEFTAGTNTYYIDTMPGYITTLLLIYLHKEILNDGIIDIRVELNSTVYTALKNGLITPDIYKSLAGKLFIEITEGKTKLITK